MINVEEQIRVLTTQEADAVAGGLTLYFAALNPQPIPPGRLVFAGLYPPPIPPSPCTSW